MKFDGENKLIIMDHGETELDLTQAYRNWKQWIMIGNNICYPFAFRVVGGDQLTDERFIGKTFFLENGWKIRPFEGNHILKVKGNLFTSDKSNPFVPTLGSYNVVIEQAVSNIIDIIKVVGYNNHETIPPAHEEVKSENSEWGVLN